MTNAAEPYQICYECEQVYATAGSLRRAYRKNVLGSGRLVRWRLWRAITVRAGQIYFCQNCLHDFFWAHR